MDADKLRLDGRVALVLGAGGGGMGTQTSLALAEAGASIVALDLYDEHLRELDEQVTALGATCMPIKVDACSGDALRSAIHAAWEAFGGIHHLVNVVGGTRPHQWFRLDNYPDEVFDEVYGFNLRSHFVSCREMAHLMITNSMQGSIVNYASVSGLGGAPYHGPYGAMKSAVISLTKTMAVEWGPLGIRVNAVAPGGTKTPRAYLGSERRSPIGDPTWSPSWNPLGRTCEPEEMAAATLFLLSDLASAITGQTLVVDAGATARSSLGGSEKFAGMQTSRPEKPNSNS